jgi:hypothetical protein
MDFPLRIPFKLGMVNNSDGWNETTESKFRDLVTIINNYGRDGLSEQVVTPSDTSILLTSDFNLASVNSGITPQTVLSNVIIDTDLKKRMYYLIVDSNRSTFTLKSDTVNLVPSNHASYNRTVYILRKLDENTVIIYKELKDMYLPASPDFDTEDFIDWDLAVG